MSRSSWVKRLLESLDWGNRAAFSIEKDNKGFFNLTVEGCPVLSVIPESPNNIENVYRALNRAYNRDIPWLVAADNQSIALYGSYWFSFPYDITNALAWNIQTDEFLLEAPKLNLLTPNEVASNELDQLYKAFPLRKRRHPIDILLVQRMSEWREMALQALGNPIATDDSMVHRLINSLFLVRYLEDSGLSDKSLRSSIGQPTSEIVRLLLERFNIVRDRTNYPTLKKTELAHLQITPLKTLIGQLYGFEPWGVEYDFSAMSVDILGRFYEEYLRLKPTSVLSVPRKSETRFLFDPPTHELTDVRREQGIFYTPQFLVQHIVSNLVRRYQASNPDEPPTVIDLACGSGTFLLAAVQELQSRKAWRDNVLQHIIGLDKDPRAVEAARLNLVAKCIADEVANPIPTLKLLNYDLLNDGVKDSKLRNLIPDDGVDIVVGNPPYIKLETLIKAYDARLLKKNFDLASNRTDSYMLFIEASLRILKNGGFCGLVLPNAFLRSSSAGHLREWIVNHADVLEIIDFQDQPIFQNVGVYVCVVLFRKRLTGQASPQVAVAKVHRLSSTPSAQLAKLGVSDESGDETQEVFHLDQPTGASAWVLRNSRERAILKKISDVSSPIKQTKIEVRQGIKTGADEVFITDGDTSIGLESMATQARKIEPGLFIPLLRHRDLRRWNTRTKSAIIYPYDRITGKLLPWSRIQKDFPVCASYLNSRKSELQKRKSLRGKTWYELIEPRVASVITKAPKLFIAELSIRPVVCMTDNRHSAVVGATGGGSWIVINESTYEPLSLMAYLNSCVSEWLLRQVASPRRGGWLLFEGKALLTLPIPSFLADSKSFTRSDLSRLASAARDLLNDSQGFQSSETRQKLASLEDQIDSLIISALDLDAEEGVYIRKRVLGLRGLKEDKGWESPLF